MYLIFIRLYHGKCLILPAFYETNNTFVRYILKKGFMKRVFLSMILLLSAVLGTMGQSVVTYYKYEYYTSTKTLSDPIEAKIDVSTFTTSGGEVPLYSGFYYVGENTNITILNIQGTDIGLIIKEGVTLNVTGIRLDTGHKLSIYTTTTDPTKFGKIVANQSHDGCSAIGGWEERMMGELVVHGVDITATGAKRGAGIGSGGMTSNQSVDMYEASGKVTIYKGKIAATGGQYAAGIGGGAGYGQYGKCGTDYIQYGGEVTATGGELAAGVGGGGSYASYSKNINQRGGSVGHVTVYGGTLNANGGRRGAGIGSGSTGTSYKDGINVNGYVQIHGGTVTANGGEYAAGIGGGCNSRGAVVTIYDGTVTANGGEDAAGIGGGEDGEGYIFTMEKGTLTVTGNGKGAAIGGGQNALGGNITIKSGTVHATAGRYCGKEDSQSGGVLGSGYGASTRDNTSGHTLTLGEYVKVRANRLYTSEYGCSPNERISACRTQYHVELSNCTHTEIVTHISYNETVSAVKYETTAEKHIGHCKFCTYSEEDTHDGTTCSVCGYKSDASNVASLYFRWAESAGEGYMSSDVQNLIISTSKYFLPFKENIGDYEFKGWLKKDTDSSPGDIEMADGETLIAPGEEVTLTSGNTYYYARYRKQYHDEWEWQDTDDHVTNKPKLTLYTVTDGENVDPIEVPAANITVTVNTNEYTKNTTVTATATYTRTEGGKNYTYNFTESLEFFKVDDIWIRDDDTDTTYDPYNEEVLSENNGNYANKIHLLGRTILGNGAWNTICLPFDIDNASLAMFDDVEEIRSLKQSFYEDRTLTLYFENLVGHKIPAGTPFLIKTKAGSPDHHSPLFTYKTVSNRYNDIETEHVAFIGTYSTLTLDDDDDEVLYLGSDNKLHYPEDGDFSLHSCQGFFLLLGLSVDDDIDDIVLNLGDESPTNIRLVSDADATDTLWYTIDGRQLNSKPAAKGIYVHQGKKFVVK